jgi:hypothetical protein
VNVADRENSVAECRGQGSITCPFFIFQGKYFSNASFMAWLLVRGTEPRLITFNAYVNDDGLSGFDDVMYEPIVRRGHSWQAPDPLHSRRCHAEGVA